MKIAARSVWLAVYALGAALLLIPGCSGGSSDDDDDSDGADEASFDDDSADDDGGYWSDDDSSDDDGWYDDDASDDDAWGDDDWWGDDDQPQDDDEPQIECPEDTSPVTLYLSADDSNSQASPVVARAIIRSGQIMPASKVRTYEFTNYYQIDYPHPTQGRLGLFPQMRVREDSEYALEYTLQIGVQSHAQNARRPMNITFSMDTSGSMGGEPISLLKETARKIVGQLQEGDVVSIVEWDNVIGVPLESRVVTGPNDPVVLEAIENLSAGGSTDLHGGLVRAYQLAFENYDPERLNRVVLISDGQANTGVTDINIIADAANDTEQEGVYLVGVGVGDPYNYFYDTLMDEVTDAGKGAYVFIDNADEAGLQFGARFNENMDVAALDVRASMTLPWYLLMHEFHGEEYSENPDEVDPQHLGPNDAMIYHQYLVACDEELVNGADEIEFGVTYTDPFSLVEKSEERSFTIDELLAISANQLLKGDAIVTYAEALKQIDTSSKDDPQDAIAICEAAREKVVTAAETLGDPELEEIAELLGILKETLGG